MEKDLILQTILEEAFKDPNLTLSRPQFERFYYGLNFYQGEDAPRCSQDLFDKVDKALKEHDPSIVRFCNFTEDGFVRFIMKYGSQHSDSSNEGICYWRLDQF